MPKFEFVPAQEQLNQGFHLPGEIITRLRKTAKFRFEIKHKLCIFCESNTGICFPVTL